ncbi:MAG: hypothetical protein K9L89_08110, partial [Kiritimatiellales bacterium]|nr:hypothetical protein [Kiritimatiellales bacterium]
LATPLVFLFGVLFSRKFLLAGYYWLHWTGPATIMITWAAAIGMVIALTSFNNWKPKAAVALALLLSLPHFVGSFAAWRSRLASDCRSIDLVTVQAGKWLAQNTDKAAVIGVNDAGATRYFSHRRTIDLMGLNCADITFNRIRPENSGIIDYLAITPSWFHGKGIYENLVTCTNFSIPPDEYTITSNKGQSEIVIFRCQ